jgi:hypothetical protein
MVHVASRTDQRRNVERRQQRAVVPLWLLLVAGFPRFPSSSADRTPPLHSTIKAVILWVIASLQIWRFASNEYCTFSLVNLIGRDQITAHSLINFIVVFGLKKKFYFNVLK